MQPKHSGVIHPDDDPFEALDGPASPDDMTGGGATPPLIGHKRKRRSRVPQAAGPGGVPTATLVFIDNNKSTKAAPAPAPEPQNLPAAPPKTMSQELDEIDDADLRGGAPSFLGNQAVFRDLLYAHLPGMADRIVKFLMTNPSTVMTPNGALTQILPDDVALTKGQVDMLKVILTKALPTMAPMTTAGDDHKPNDNVRITIQTVGGKVGINAGPVPLSESGHARPIGVITFEEPPPEAAENNPANSADFVEIPVQDQEGQPDDIQERK